MSAVKEEAMALYGAAVDVSNDHGRRAVGGVISVTGTKWMLDAKATGSTPPGLFAFCPVTLDENGALDSVFTALTLVAAVPPGPFHGVFHEDGDEAVKQWSAQNEGILEITQEWAPAAMGGEFVQIVRFSILALLVIGITNLLFAQWFIAIFCLVAAAVLTRVRSLKIGQVRRPR